MSRVTGGTKAAGRRKGVRPDAWAVRCPRWPALPLAWQAAAAHRQPGGELIWSGCGCPGRVAVCAGADRRAASARSSMMAAAAATTAAPSAIRAIRAIRAICQLAMPPTVTARTGAAGTGARGVIPSKPGSGLMVAEAAGTRNRRPDSYQNGRTDWAVIADKVSKP